MSWNLRETKPIVGDLICAMYSHVHVWNEDLDDEVDELGRGEFMIVLAAGHPNRPKRLNPEYYRKVLTANQKIGWVHLDNCEPVRRYN